MLRKLTVSAGKMKSRASTQRWLMFTLATNALISATPVVSQTNPSENKSPPAHIVWSEPDDMGADIYYARQLEDEWTEPALVSGGDHFDIAPCLASVDGSRHWVVWTRMLSPFRSELVLREFDGRTWLPEQRVKTTTTANTGAMLLASPSTDSPMQLSLFWSGFDGEDDEVFYSVSRDPFVDWTAPTRIAPNNSFPDIQPMVGRQDNGMPWVMWVGFNGTKYVRQSVGLTELGFSRPKPVDDKDPRLVQLAEVSLAIPAWPGHISKPKSACITTGYPQMPSLPLRFVDLDGSGDNNSLGK